VVRGAWVADRLLGEEIPPPPANVPAIEPDIRGATTIQEMLEKHLSDDSCSACHVKIDPPGFALENFDAAGQWRDYYTIMDGRSRKRGRQIKASYQLADGREFGDFTAFQELILESPEKLAENLAAKLLTYGTGAEISFSDRETLQQIVEQTRDKNFGIRSIVKAVVSSDIFLTK
jgi:hypothetical protein